METREKATFARYRWADRDIWIKPSFWWGPRYIAPVFPLMKEKKKVYSAPIPESDCRDIPTLCDQ